MSGASSSTSSSSSHPACKNLHQQPLPVPDRSPILPAVYVYDGPHPQRLPRNDGKGVDYVLLVDITDKQSISDLLVFGFRRPVSRRGNSTTSSFPPANLQFSHDNGDILLEVGDMVYFRQKNGDGDSSLDVCITFGFHIADLGISGLMRRAQSLQDRLVGDRRDATRSAPVMQGDGLDSTRGGATAFERDPRSHPIANTERAIPVTISVEPQQGGLHAPTAGNRYIDQPDGTLSDQDLGFHLRREYTQLSAELAALGLQKFGPVGLADIYRRHADIVNAPPVGFAGNPGFTNQQSNQASPQSRSTFDQEESAVDSIKEIGPFGNLHADTKDLLAGLSFLLSLSRLLLQRGGHPGLMILTGLGVAWRLDPFVGFYMCGLHSHAGTVPTFAPDMADDIEEDHVRILNIMYMSRFVLGGDGPSALASASPSSVFKISPEFRNPRYGPGTLPELCTHNTYARDGISIMHARDLGRYIARELLLATIGVLLQLPQFMAFRLDRKAFLNAFSFQDDDGARFQIDDWELGPGHGPGGVDHPTPDDPALVASGTLGPVHYNNHARARAMEEWAAHEALQADSVPLSILARSLPKGPASDLPSAYTAMINRAKKGEDVLQTVVNPSNTKKRSAEEHPEAPRRKARRGIKRGDLGRLLQESVKLPADIFLRAVEQAAQEPHDGDQAGLRSDVEAVSQDHRSENPEPPSSLPAMDVDERVADEPSVPLPDARQQCSLQDSAGAPSTTPMHVDNLPSQTAEASSPEPPDEDGEPELDADYLAKHAAARARANAAAVKRSNEVAKDREVSRKRRTPAALKFLRCFDLEALQNCQQATAKSVTIALRATTLRPDAAAMVSQIDSALSVLADEPLGKGAPHAIASLLASTTRLFRAATLQDVADAFQRQRVMVNFLTAHNWVIHILAPRLAQYANAVIQRRPAPDGPGDLPWLYKLAADVYEQLDDRQGPTKRAKGKGHKNKGKGKRAARNDDDDDFQPGGGKTPPTRPNKHDTRQATHAAYAGNGDGEDDADDPDYRPDAEREHTPSRNPAERAEAPQRGRHGEEPQPEQPQTSAEVSADQPPDQPPDVFKANKYLSSLTKTAKLKRVRTSPSAVHEQLVQATSRIVLTWLGFEESCKTHDTKFACALISPIYAHLGGDALLLRPVWDAFCNPGSVVGIFQPKSKPIDLNELKDLHRLFPQLPVTSPTSPERQVLHDIQVEFSRILKHARLPPLPPPPPKPQPRSVNMLTFLRLSLALIPDHRQPARLPDPLPPSTSGLHRRFLLHMLDDTDRRLPVRASARAYGPLLSPDGPLHPSNLRSVEGLFSMGTFRGTTYHSSFALQNVFFKDAKAFLDKVAPLPREDFVIADAYQGHAQPTRVTHYQQHAMDLWHTVQQPSANWWLADQPRTEQPARDVSPSGNAQDEPSSLDSSVPESTFSQPALPPRPSYEDVLAVILDKQHKFPMLGPLTAHLLVADYVDAGVLEPPSVETMARVICQINAGALSGLHALDYFHNRDALDYVKENAFISLYRDLDAQLTADEKRRLNWGPICLEHALCKYYRFVTHPDFALLFEPTYFSTNHFRTS